MINQDEYNHALHALMQGAMNVGPTNPVEAMKILMNLPNFAWDITRPDAYTAITDLTHRLSELDGLADKVTELRVVILFDGDDKPIVGYGEGRTCDGALFEPGDPTTPEGRFIDNCINEAMVEMGITPDTPGIQRLDDVMRAMTEKVIDDKVAEFRSELDTLLQTWDGG